MGLNATDLQRFGAAAQKQVLDKLKADIQSKKSKYHNEPDSRGDLRFDSRKEARRYDELVLFLKAGQIRNLRLQAQYTLVEGFTDGETGEKVRPVRYVADFAYDRVTTPDCTGTVYWIPVVEDVKSRATKTPQYEIKKKLMAEKYRIYIEEVL